MAAILADDIYNRIFLNENHRISLKYVPRSSIDNKPALVQVMAWRRTGDKPLPKPMLTQFIWRIYVALGGDELTFLGGCINIKCWPMFLKCKCYHFASMAARVGVILTTSPAASAKIKIMTFPFEGYPILKINHLYNGNLIPGKMVFILKQTLFIFFILNINLSPKILRHYFYEKIDLPKTKKPTV